MAESRTRGLIARGFSFVKSAAALYLMASVIGRLGAILLLPLYTKRLSPQEYGGYALAGTLLAVLPSLYSCGLSAGLSKVYFDAPRSERAKSERDVGAVARGLVSMALAIALVSALVVHVFFPEGVSLLTKRHLLLVVATSFCTAAGSVPEVYFRAAQRPWPAVTLQVVQLLMNAACGFVLVARYGRGLDGALEAVAAGQSIVALTGIVFAFVILRGGETIETTRRVFLFSLAFVPHLLASWLQNMGDRWVLSTYRDGEELGIYYVAVQLLSPIALVTAAWNAAETPKVGERSRDHGPTILLQTLPSELRRYLAAALVPTLGLLILSPIIPYFLGPNFVGALKLMPVLAAAFVVDALYYPASNVVFFGGRPRAIPIVTVATATISLGLSYVLLHAFGVPGLLVSRLVTSIFRTTALVIVGRRMITNLLRSTDATAHRDLDPTTG